MWSNKKIKVIICNDAESEHSTYCGRTEWIAEISYAEGEEIFKDSPEGGWCHSGGIWHTFNQKEAEKYTLGNFKGRSKNE